MEWILRLECRDEHEVLHERDIARFERQTDVLRPEEVGLSLLDAKTLLHNIQWNLVRDQAAFQATAGRKCPHCGERKRIKDYRHRKLRTLFGAIPIRCPRYQGCVCLGAYARADWPLSNALPERHTPEFVYLLAKLGSAMPYRKAIALLHELLPLSRGDASYGNVRRRTLAVGDELERRATDRAEYDDCGPGRAPVAEAEQITVALDGTYVRADRSAFGRQLHVIAGRIERNGKLGNRFAWVPEAAKACSPKMMRSALDDDGYTDGTRLSVLADGADGLSGVVRDGTQRTPFAQLDWFHVSMRLRHIEQMTPKIVVLMPNPEAQRLVSEQVPRLRWLVWHGRTKEVLPLLARMSRATKLAMRASDVMAHDRLARFRRHAVQLHRYLRNNGRGLINYALARRRGQRISTAPAESGMGHLVKERMGKGKPIRWSAESDVASSLRHARRSTRQPVPRMVSALPAYAVDSRHSRARSSAVGRLQDIQTCATLWSCAPKSVTRPEKRGYTERQMT
jgi:hypothetical protein